MMKKITLFMLMLVGLTINAQVYYSEDFEAETLETPPSTFTILNEDACTVNSPTLFSNEAWIVSEGGDAQGQFAAAQSWTNPAACTVDDWLISPAIDLSSASANTSLKWKGRSFEGPNFPEIYEVRISTTGTAIANFSTILLTVNPEAEVWTDRTVSLAPYIGGTVYVAFRLISTDQSQLWIDDITVSEPAPFDLALTSVTTNGVNQTSAFSNGQFLIVDFSKRTNFTSSAVLTNVGTNAVDSAYLTYFLVDDLNAPTEGVAFGDTIYFSPALAPNATYTHTFEAFGLDTLFPNLLSDQVLDFYIQIDSSNFNYVVDDLDFNYNILVAPAESYTIPYSTSFEVADLNAGQFLFDHATWGWKYFDLDNDGISLAVGNAFTNLPAQDGSMQVYGSIVNGNTLSLGADNERMQSPELTLTGGSAYSFSIYARTGFGVTGTIQAQLVSAAAPYTNTLGTITLTAADSTYEKYSFDVIVPSTQTDYMVNFNKSATGFLILDLFEVVELQLPTVNISLAASSIDAPGVEYCDSTVTVNFNATGNPSSMSLNWGDGTIVNVTGLSSATHTYGSFGNYTIALTATNIVGSGNNSTSVNFTAVPAPTVTFGPPAVANQTVTVSIGTTIGSNIVYTPSCSRVIIDWGDGTIDEVTGQTSASHTYTATGDFTITASVLGTATASATQDVFITVGINDINFVEALNIYPNPSNRICKCKL
jgi:hypothetical protein